MVYIGYVHDKMFYCSERVGVFAKKSTAYRAVRNRVNEMILEHWAFWVCNTRYRNDYNISWSIEPVQIKNDDTVGSIVK